MSGIFVSKTLGGGHLANTLSFIYQVPASNVGYVKHFSITGNSANIQQITLYKHINGANIRWLTFALAFGDTADVLEGDTLVMSANHGICAQTNLAFANAATYSLHGVEEQ